VALKFLVFQHCPWEGPGRLFKLVAEKRNVELDVVRVWKESIPNLAPYDGLVVLGGGANVDQEKEFPFLIEEKKAITRSVADDRPYLGFCLGHQLLAETLGAEVGRNHKSSIGFITGYLTHNGNEHPVFSGLPDCFPVFKWHGQAVKEPLPGHVEILATSVDCQIEAIGVAGRPHILGMQFDNHSASGQEVASWLDNDEDWLASLPDVTVNRREMLEAAERHGMEIECEFDMIFANFLGLIDGS
jgi:GMP synthase-like glutamine amidotransferase